MEPEYQNPVNPHPPEITAKPVDPPAPRKPSEFDGTTLQRIGWRLLGLLLSAVTLGIATPWAQCMIYRWETKHTLVEGKRLRFDGTGLQLLGNYLLWGLLSIVTLGIYLIFVPVRMNNWRAYHTKFADETQPVEKTSGWAITAAVLASLLVLTLAGGLFLFMDVRPADKHTAQRLPEDILSIFREEEESPILSQENIIIHDGQNVIIWSEMESFPTEAPEISDGIYRPSPDDDGDFWYVDEEDGLNVRTGPDVSYDLIRTLPHGAEVEVLDWENGWAFLGYGWCAGNYLEINRPKDAVKPDTSIVGTWAFVFQRDKREQWNDDIYDVAVLEFRADGTFQSTTVQIDYGNIGGSDGWMYFPTTDYRDGRLEPSYQGNYTFDGTYLQMNYLVSDGKGDRDLLRSLKTKVYNEGDHLRLGDPDDFLLYNPDQSRGTGKPRNVLLPIEQDSDWQYSVRYAVARYIEG